MMRKWDIITDAFAYLSHFKLCIMGCLDQHLLPNYTKDAYYLGQIENSCAMFSKQISTTILLT